MLSLWWLVAIVGQLQAAGPAANSAFVGESPTVAAQLENAQVKTTQAETPLTAPAGNGPATAVGQAEIVETRLPPYAAAVAKIAAGGVEVHLNGQNRTIAFDQLLRTRFAAAGKPAAAGKISVELADGSLATCSQFTSDGKIVKLAWAADDFISVPARQVASCLLQPLDATRAKQWEAIVESKSAADVLVVQRSAEALDKIEGVINEVTDAAVKFQFDGQAIDVQRSKLAGWKYYAPEPGNRPKLLAVVRDHHGSSWMAQSIAGDWSSGDGHVALQLVCGVDLKLPIGSIVDIDFSFGSMRFLADLQPLERKVQPRFALAIALPETETLFGPRPAPADTQRGANVGPGVEFMGSGSIVYRVPNDFRRLLGSVALTPEGPQFVPCKVQILVEEKVVWEKTLTSAQEVLPIEIAVEPGKRVRLTVQAESGQPVGDHVAWRQLRFVK